jgi:hypothetical protein
LHWLLPIIIVICLVSVFALGSLSVVCSHEHVGLTALRTYEFVSSRICLGLSRHHLGDTANRIVRIPKLIRILYHHFFLVSAETLRLRRGIALEVLAVVDILEFSVIRLLH